MKIEQCTHEYIEANLEALSPDLEELGAVFEGALVCETVYRSEVAKRLIAKEEAEKRALLIEASDFLERALGRKLFITLSPTFSLGEEINGNSLMHYVTGRIDYLWQRVFFSYPPGLNTTVNGETCVNKAAVNKAVIEALFEIWHNNKCMEFNHGK
jgi:hypothetical protein